MQFILNLFNEIDLLKNQFSTFFNKKSCKLCSVLSKIFMNLEQLRPKCHMRITIYMLQVLKSIVHNTVHNKS